MIKKAEYNEEEIEKRHSEGIERLKNLLPIMHNVRQRHKEIRKNQSNAYTQIDETTSAFSMQKAWNLYKKSVKQVAKEFNITSSDVDDILVGDPFDILVEEGIVSAEEMGRLW